MKAGDDTRQHREKLLSVLVIQENVLPSIAPGRDVIERLREFDAKRSSHVGHIHLTIDAPNTI